MTFEDIPSTFEDSSEFWNFDILFLSVLGVF